MSRPQDDGLLAAVEALTARVEALEAELAAVRSQLPPPAVPEEVVIAISSAVAAFLGHSARLKQVRYATSATWAQQGRAAAVQRSTIRHR